VASQAEGGALDGEGGWGSGTAVARSGAPAAGSGRAAQGDGSVVGAECCGRRPLAAAAAAERGPHCDDGGGGWAVLRRRQRREGRAAVAAARFEGRVAAATVARGPRAGEGRTVARLAACSCLSPANLVVCAGRSCGVVDWASWWLRR
jgi:hypothetical protein